MNTGNKFIFGSIIGFIVVAAVFGFIAKQSDDRTPNTQDTTMATTTLLAGRAVLKTNRGDVEITFFDFAPQTANNFITLAREGFYDGTRFHRVIAGFMIQGGDPLSRDVSTKEAWGTGGPGYTIEDEFAEGMTNLTGTIAMANTGQPDSGGSQFFINVADNTGLDFDKEPLTSKHPVFGRITSGMDVVLQIAELETEGADRPREDVVIERIEILGE